MNGFGVSSLCLSVIVLLKEINKRNEKQRQKRKSAKPLLFRQAQPNGAAYLCISNQAPEIQGIHSAWERIIDSDHCGHGG